MLLCPFADQERQVLAEAVTNYLHKRFRTGFSNFTALNSLRERIDEVVREKTFNREIKPTLSDWVVHSTLRSRVIKGAW